jgi:acetolactate synthase regulatory subunit
VIVIDVFVDELVLVSSYETILRVTRELGFRVSTVGSTQVLGKARASRITL